MKRILLYALGLVLLLTALVAALNFRDEEKIADTPASVQATPEQMARGEYLARAGNCMTCHTTLGGKPYAGGREIDTPFGKVYAPNITPDPQTGIGGWSAAHFWRALHNGRSRDGRLLYPAFPYPNYTRVTRVDSDALFSYLRSLPAVPQANRPHALRFPYDSQWSLAVWRALFFSPGSYEQESDRSAEWNRGAYLVQGLGHCNACHAGRNLLGATGRSLDLGGGFVSMQKWYAPSLTSPLESGLADVDTQQIVDLLKTGVSAQGSAMGPMAIVVLRSTQYLSDADLRAMATYLRSLPQRKERRPELEPGDPARLERGAKLYESHCAACHGDAGEGAPGAYPRLAGSRAVMMNPPANLVHIVIAGGFPPSTTGNPRPYGMPPFATALSNDDVSAVVSYIRRAWGNQGTMVLPFDVHRYRGEQP